MSFFRRMLAGRVAPGWLADLDEPDYYDDWSPGGNGDHAADWPEDHAPPLMPDRPYTPEDRTEWSRRPLVPEALRNPAEAAKLALKRAAWVVAFHVIRIPKYARNQLLWAPRGLSRSLVGFTRWLTVYEARGVVYAAGWHAKHTGEDHQFRQYLRLQQAQKATSRERTALAVLLVFGLVLAGWTAAQRWDTTVALGVVLLVVLGYLGRPMDRPYIESAVVSVPGAVEITADMMVKALHAARLCRETIGDGPEVPKFATPVYREGAGYGAVIDLPFGYTAEQAIKKKTEIAAGLRVDDFRLFIEQVRGDGGHAGRIRLWVADSDPHTGKATKSPLVKANKFDLWHEVPFGTDERGQHVAFPLVWTSVLIGSLPRMGKSNAMRVLLSAAALDPHTKLIVFDGKGGKDFAALEQVCHAFGAGEDDDVVAALVAQLTELKGEMHERFKRLRRLPDDVCPEAKVTHGLTRRRDLNMPLVVVAIDEFHTYLENKRYGKTIEELLTSLIKIGPGAGIILVCATQRPSSKIMETDFRDVFGTRFAMRVTTRDFSEMILGSGASKIGLDASKFLPSHKGVGILRGTDDGELADQPGRTVHAYVMDLVAFRAVCDRARALREGAGTLTGVAAGEEPEVLSDHFLPHVIKAFRGEQQAHSDVLCARLAEDYPGLYADPETRRPSWDPNDLATALNRYGVQRRTKGVWAPRLEDGESTTRKGFLRDDIVAAAEKRTPPVPDSPAEWTE